MTDIDEAGRCPTCDSRRHMVCTGFPGAVYVKHGQGWFPYNSALALEAEGHEVMWDDVWAYSNYGIRPPNRIVVVDTETSGLDPRSNEMIEVAWTEVGENGGQVYGIQSAVVPHTLSTFSPEALEINRYRERDLGRMEDWANPRHLREILSATFEGAVIAGSNVDFDKSFLMEWDWHVGTWDHKPVQIGSVVMGHLGRRYPLSLRHIPEALGLTSEPDHTAAGDVRVVVEALRKMWGES